MKYLLSAFLCVMLLSCSNRYYNYQFEMTEPMQTAPLKYENDTMAVQFKFTPQTVGFVVQNKITDGIRINWDEVSLSMGGKAYRVVHKETGMTKINDLQPPTTIPPQSALTDIIVPTDNIHFVHYKNTYAPIYTGIFLNYAGKKAGKEILKRKGEKVVVFMPFRIADKYVAKTFYFTISDITITKKKEF